MTFSPRVPPTNSPILVVTPIGILNAHVTATSHTPDHLQILVDAYLPSVGFEVYAMRHGSSCDAYPTWRWPSPNDNGDEPRKPTRFVHPFTGLPVPM